MMIKTFTIEFNDPVIIHLCESDSNKDELSDQ